MILKFTHHYKEKGKPKTQFWIHKNVKEFHIENQCENGLWLFITYENNEETAIEYEPENDYFEGKEK